MTSSQLLQQVVPEPFASESDALATISTGTPSDAISFKLGFPPAFSSPRSGGGEYILRGMMNAVGNLASANEHFRQAGGLYQFNQKWAAANNGYPKNAVLDFLNGNKLYKVLSLIDNNMYDYTGSTPTETGVIQGGVDGIHWMYCNVDQEVKYNEICDVPDFSWPYANVIQEGSSSVSWAIDDTFPIGLFKAPRDGFITISGSCTFDVSPLKWKNSTGQLITDSYISTGFCIAVCSEKDSDGRIKSPFEAQGDTIYARGNFSLEIVNTPNNIIYNYNKQNPLVVTSGTDYQIYIINKGSTINDSTMKVVLI